MTSILSTAVSVVSGALGALAVIWFRGRRGHVYLSTSCFHGGHDYCKGKEGQAGPKVPATCKFCGAPCICRCHREE